MAQSNAARTLISFCMNLSSMVLVAVLPIDAARLLCQMYICFCFSFFSQFFSGMLEASRFPGRQRRSPLREVKSICGAHCCWYGAKIEIGNVIADTCARCGEMLKPELLHTIVQFRSFGSISRNMAPLTLIFVDPINMFMALVTAPLE
jgi:hypothetical protein